MEYVISKLKELLKEENLALEHALKNEKPELAIEKYSNRINQIKKCINILVSSIETTKVQMGWDHYHLGIIRNPFTDDDDRSDWAVGWNIACDKQPRPYSGNQLEIINGELTKS